MNLIEMYNLHVENYIECLKSLNNDELTTEERRDLSLKLNISANGGTMFALGLLVNMFDLFMTNSIKEKVDQNSNFATAKDLGL